MDRPTERTRAAILYTRAGCPPCFALRRTAARAARRARVELEVVDVDGDADLARRYGTEVPVLVLPGGRTLAGRVESAEVEAAFRAAGRRPQGAAAAIAGLRGRIVRWARIWMRRERGGGS